MAKGDLQTVGRRRKEPASAKVKARVAKFRATDSHPGDCIEAADETPRIVQPLNPGFFMLERLRSQTVAKAKATRKAKVRGK